MDNLEFETRRVDVRNLEELIDITKSVGWEYGEIYWRVILACSTGYAVYHLSGEMAGCAFAVKFGAGRGNIGVVIVRPEYRGKGIASHMMDLAEGHILENGKGTVTLVATEDGYPVYEHRGYEVISKCYEMFSRSEEKRGEVPHLPNVRFSSISDKNFSDVLLFDKREFAEDRSHGLTALREASISSVVLNDVGTGEILGFGIIYPRADMLKIGPVVAKEQAQAEAIVKMLSYGKQGIIRTDVFAHQPGYIEFLKSLGFNDDWNSTVMALNGHKGLVDLPGVFSIGAQTVG
ncbi:GNAT family N-acetyltransferase [Sneathiella sp. P13V-1]|uniref:GNAT family N-acetyltransferase n=1 Tax=Sneathiella sp. P13V-1 TaxID=2697366 RepID=UPI00187B83A9|nr:GNAT family N-acetyltransferase [Sneathiella sp. P13V-1]MBE7637252.1 GNAT family N-acetyltransferase [Sneathiella sp. P13V-1]